MTTFKIEHEAAYSQWCVYVREQVGVAPLKHGKINHSRTYFASDRQDAIDTKAMMISEAKANGEVVR